MSADAVPILVTNPVAPLESLFNVPIAAMQSVRQQFTFRWANAAARTAQTGMRANDYGYQADIDTTWRYSGSAWVLWDSPWTTAAPALTMGSGWTLQQQGSAVRSGVLYLNVICAKGSAITAGNAPFTFTAPYLPLLDYGTSAWTGVGGASDAVGVEVSATGTVSVWPATGAGSNTQIRLMLVHPII